MADPVLSSLAGAAVILCSSGAGFVLGRLSAPAGRSAIGGRERGPAPPDPPTELEAHAERVVAELQPMVVALQTEARKTGDVFALSAAPGDGLETEIAPRIAAALEGRGLDDNEQTIPTALAGADRHWRAPRPPWRTPRASSSTREAA